MQPLEFGVGHDSVRMEVGRVIVDLADLRLPDNLPLAMPDLDLVPLGGIAGTDPLAGHFVAVSKGIQDEPFLA